MEDSLEYELKQKNKKYYQNMSTITTQKRKKKKEKVNKSTSFASRKVDFSSFLLVPKNYEALSYSLYILLIPYSVGNLFLFFAVGGGELSNYSLLDKSAFLIVWAIGYEIVAILSLIWITILYIKD